MTSVFDFLKVLVIAREPVTHLGLLRISDQFVPNLSQLRDNCAKNVNLIEVMRFQTDLRDLKVNFVIFVEVI